MSNAHRIPLILAVFSLATATAHATELDDAKALAKSASSDTNVYYISPTGLAAPTCISVNACDKPERERWLIGRDATRLAAAAQKQGTASPTAGSNLLVLKVPAAAETGAAPPAPTAPAAPAAQPSPTLAPSSASPKDVATRYLSRSSASTLNDAHSGVASETLQILGQIVADRASGAAVAAVLARLRDKLKCDPKETSPLPRVCEVLKTVRLQDLAGAGDTLLAALVADIFAKFQGNIKNAHAKAEVEAALALLATALPELNRARRDLDAPNASGVGRRLFDKMLLQFAGAKVTDGLLRGASDATWSTWSRGQKTVGVAAIAYGECMTRTRDGQPVTLATLPSPQECATSRYVQEAAKFLGVDERDGELRLRAEALVSQVIAAQTLLSKSDTPLWRQRTTHAIDAAFDVICLLTDSSAPPANAEADLPALPACPAEIPAKAPASTIEWLSTAHYFMASAVDGDINGLLVAGATVIGDDERKGLRLLAGVLRYAQTYTGETGKNPDAHERRVKLLEDLTEDMTDRTEREGDCVWSLGGALALLGGGRIPLEDGEDEAILGPVSLPLGLGFQQVGGGVHLLVGIVDLGQYVAWKPGLEVTEPNVEDALSPSLSVGYAWGTSFPAFVAATAGYTPHYAFSSTSNKGSLNLGITTGVYVPLLDVN
jgi:hypothetical protein